MKTIKNIQLISALLLVTGFGCSPQFLNGDSVNDLTPPLPKPTVSVRNFDQINETLSSLTGVSIRQLPQLSTQVTQGDQTFTVTGNAYIRPEGGGLKFELPMNTSLPEFNSSHQGAIVRLAAIYCDQFVKGQTAGSAARPTTLNAGTINNVASDYYNRFWGSCTVKPDLMIVQNEVNDLISDLNGGFTGDDGANIAGINSTSATQVDNYLKLTCSVFLSSACATMF
jgi:hypothetical protein